MEDGPEAGVTGTISDAMTATAYAKLQFPSSHATSMQGQSVAAFKMACVMADAKVAHADESEAILSAGDRCLECQASSFAPDCDDFCTWNETCSRNGRCDARRPPHQSQHQLRAARHRRRLRRGDRVASGGRGLPSRGPKSGRWSRPIGPLGRRTCHRSTRSERQRRSRCRRDLEGRSDRHGRGLLTFALDSKQRPLIT